MQTMTPLPSPNGTNYERLYIVRDPRMALDQQMQSGSSNDLVDSIRELLAGKLDDADIEALLKLIGIGTPGGAQDRRRRFASDTAMRKHVSAGLAKRAAANHTSLVERFPDAARMRSLG
jgi:hypothetical protein